MFGFIGSIIGGAISLAGSALSAIGSAIGGALKGAVSLCKSLGNLASLKVLGPLVSIASGILGPLGPIVAELIIRKMIEVGLKLLLGTDKEKADEMGYRLEEADKHADWKKSSDFDSFKEYYEYLKQQIPDEEIDREKLKKDKYYYESVAIDKMADETGKKYGIKVEPEFFIEIGRSAMEEKEVEAIIAAYKSLGYDRVALSDYFKGKLSPAENQKIRDALFVTLKNAYPQKSDANLRSRLSIMRRCSNDDKFMAEHSYDDALKDIHEKGNDSEYLR